jgi:succinate dehydrogenase / fumarate reductase, flavoprotein subunit
MQGLADGYFIVPHAVSNYIATIKPGKVSPDAPEFSAAQKETQDKIKTLLAVNGNTTVDEFHRRLGKILWDKCGMARSKAGLEQAIQDIRALRASFWKEVKVLGTNEELNTSLEKAGRVADFLEFGELMCIDALDREESCGGHFRVEHQTEEGEAKRHDEKFTYAAAWEYKGEGVKPELHKEELKFENIHLQTRSYK